MPDHFVTKFEGSIVDALTFEAPRRPEDAGVAGAVALVGGTLHHWHREPGETSGDFMGAVLRHAAELGAAAIRFEGTTPVGERP